jgi:hypothetical protein
MGTVFKKTFTKPLPADAEVFLRGGEHFARWKDTKGKTRKAKVTTGKKGQRRVLVESRTYTAKYRDGSGNVQTVATACRDEQAARSVLGELERRAELVKSKVMTAAESAATEHLRSPIAAYREAYLTHLKAKGVSLDHHDNVERQLKRLMEDCRIGTLADLDARAVERWLTAKATTGKYGPSARTRNTYLAALLAFANWCVDEGRLIVNPFIRIPKADEKADVRRKRRAMNEAELVKLLAVARRRPLLDAMTIRRGRLKGEAVAKLKDETRERLDLLNSSAACAERVHAASA